MHALMKTAGSKSSPVFPAVGRMRYEAFSWWARMHIPTREKTRSRNVGRGWRALLIETQA